MERGTGTGKRPAARSNTCARRAVFRSFTDMSDCARDASRSSPAGLSLDLFALDVFARLLVVAFDVFIRELADRASDLAVVGLVEIRERHPPRRMLRAKAHARQQHDPRIGCQTEQQLRRLR